MTLRVPDAVANAAAAWGADWWLRELPRLVADLEAEWSVSVKQPYPHASEAFVAEASLGDGTPAVLKLLIPRDGAAARHEITMLRLAGGRGCAGLLRHDAARGAMLLERLGPSLYELGRPLSERLEILVATAATVWRSAAGSGLPTGADKARRLVDFVTTQCARLRSGRAGRARSCCGCVTMGCRKFPGFPGTGWLTARPGSRRRAGG